MKALCATASTGVVSGGVNGGEEDVDEFEEVDVKVGDGKPELPRDGGLHDPPWLWSAVLILLGRPCWKRQRVP